MAPDGQVIINTGIMLERLTNGQIPIGWHRVVAAPGLRRRALQRRAVLPPAAVDDAVAGAELLHARAPAALPRPQSAADALDEVLYQINLVEDARRLTS